MSSIMSGKDIEPRIKQFINFNDFEETCNFTECLGGSVDFIDIYNNVKLEKQKKEQEDELRKFYADHDIDPALEEPTKLQEYLALQKEEPSSSSYSYSNSKQNYYSSSDSEDGY